MTGVTSVILRILDTAGLSQEACAASLGLSPQVFAEMLAGQRAIPDSMIPLTAAVLGVHETVLSSTAREGRSSDIVPAIWYKLRSEGLTEADREYVLAVRQLAFYQHELELITDSRCVGWKALFEELKRQTDPQASPTDQGRQAARLFRRSTGLDKGAIGIGEVFRGYLRNIGVLVIESTAQASALEGCSFYVGPSGAERPSIFANSYRTTWFRRNSVLMHELAHAIFDVESMIASLDFTRGDSVGGIEEKRAEAFAQEALVPFEVVRNLGQRQGIRWETLDHSRLAALVAATHVEQRLLVKALLDSKLITDDLAESLKSCDIADELRRLSTHALSTVEFLRSAHVQEGGFKRRTTTTTPRKLLLPVRYVTAVLQAIKSRIISRGKAARMLMIDEYEFADRFMTEQSAYAD